MNINRQISLDERIWADLIRISSPLGLDPSQVIQQALSFWLLRYNGQRFEQDWIAALRQTPDETNRAEDWMETQEWSEV
ncbi:MAG: hypothetical protein ACKV2V_25970 [Blastocatellia bacterium]